MKPLTRKTGDVLGRVGSADPAVRRTRVDGALADDTTGVRGVPHHAAAGVDADMSGEEHQVAGHRLAAGDPGGRGALLARRAWQADPDLGHDVADVAGAVEAG